MLSRSAETMGCILGIPEDIMGLTLTAGGTSLPNMFSSMIVAKQGLGTMSVSNAFGSNTFNIFIALALPWFVGASRSPTGRCCALSCSDWQKWTHVSWHLLTDHVLLGIRDGSEDDWRSLSSLSLTGSASDWRCG